MLVRQPAGNFPNSTQSRSEKRGEVGRVRGKKGTRKMPFRLWLRLLRAHRADRPTDRLEEAPDRNAFSPPPPPDGEHRPSSFSLRIAKEIPDRFSFPCRLHLRLPPPPLPLPLCFIGHTKTAAGGGGAAPLLIFETAARRLPGREN